MTHMAWVQRDMQHYAVQHHTLASLLIQLSAAGCGAHFGVRPPMIDSSEVLPLPLGPMSASSSPGRQHPVMLCRICGAIGKAKQHLISAERPVVTSVVCWHVQHRDLQQRTPKLSIGRQIDYSHV